MMETPHLGFIVAAYAFAALTILAMVAAILLDYRALGAKLRAIEDARADYRALGAKLHALEDARADAAEGRQT